MEQKIITDTNKIVAIIYALDKSKGSESGMGYNFALNLIKKHPNISIITRSNNNCHDLSNVIGIDLHPIILKLKRLFKLHLIYYFFWQIFISIKFFKKFDTVYQVNFHSDWMPLFSFLISKSKWIVGPIGHHGSSSVLKKIFSYNKSYFIKELLSTIYKKLIFTLWNSWILYFFSTRVYTLNKKSWIKSKKLIYLPSVGIEDVHENEELKKEQVVYVGRLVDLKGVRLIPYIASKNIDYNFIVVGDGPLKNYLIKKCKYFKNVKFKGWIDRSEVLKLFSNSKYLLFPSFEGAGMVVAEAGAYGCWPVVFKDTGPHEIMNDYCTPIDSVKEFRKINFKNIKTDISGLKNYVRKNLLFKDKFL